MFSRPDWRGEDRRSLAILNRNPTFETIGSNVDVEADIGTKEKVHCEHIFSTENQYNSLKAYSASQHNKPSRGCVAFRKRTLVLWIQVSVAFLVLGANLGWTIWATRTFGTRGGVGTVYQGSCAFSKSLNTYFHVAINVLATVLLGTSNYCMQVVSSPTRSVVDAAHARWQWVDIGVPSIRNLSRLTWKSRLLWVGLMLTAAVLHLFWNSAVFTSLPAYEYGIAVVTEDFADFNQSWGRVEGYNLDGMRLNASKFERLENEACIDRYIGPLKGGKDVIVVTKERASASNNQTLIRSQLGGSGKWYFSGYWICGSSDIFSSMNGGGCTLESISPFLTKWSVARNNNASQSGAQGSVAISHCLSAGLNPSKNMCAVHFSSTIMWIVIIMNGLVCTFVLYVAVDNVKTKHLVTLGDAIASFLEHPDPHTKNMVMLDKEAFTKTETWYPQPTYWQPRQARWKDAVSPRRFWCTAILYICMIVIVLALLLAGIAGRNRDKRPTSLQALWEQGLGTPDSQSILTGAGSPSDLFGTVVMANSFQLAYSALYFLLNGCFSCMLVAVEWAGFAAVRKGLRVSAPGAGQRSSYFLSIPFRYGIPLLVGSALQQWLVSQSIFLIRTNTYAPNSTSRIMQVSNRVGYSPMAIILTLLSTVMMMTGLLFLAFRMRYPGGDLAMPLASTCSASIAASCHRSDKDHEAHLLPVQWGVYAEDNGIGKVAFTTAEELERPITGKLYA